MSDSVDLREEVVRRLEAVIDPETGVDVIRMRLIEDLTTSPDGHVSYSFRPSSALCPLAVPLAVQICRAVDEVPGVSGQLPRVEGHVRADEITAMLRELADGTDD